MTHGMLPANGANLQAADLASGLALANATNVFPTLTARANTTTSMSGGRVVVTETGLYLMLGSAEFQSFNGGTQLTVGYRMLIITGYTNSLRGCYRSLAGGSKHTCFMSRIIELTAGQEIGLQLYQSQGSTINADRASIEIVRVG